MDVINRITRFISFKMIKLFNKEISDIYFGSKPVSAIYSGSRLVWMRSSGSEEVVYRFLDAIQFDFRNSGFGDANGIENYYRTADTITANEITFPVYVREDGERILKVEYNSGYGYTIKRYQADGTTFTNVSWSTDENSNIIPFTDYVTMEQEEWFTMGESATIPTILIPAKAYEVTIVSTDSAASDYVGTKTFTLTNYYSHPSDDDLPIYKSDDGVYMFIAGGGNASSYGDWMTGRLMFSKNISSFYRPYIYSESDWVEDTHLDPNYKGGLYLMQDWINEYSFIGDDAEGDDTFIASITFQSVLPAASAALTNATLAGFPANAGFNGMYVNTGTTKTVSWYDYDAGESVTKSFPVFYNGSKYLYVTTNPFSSEGVTWAVGSSTSSGNYYHSSTNTDGSLAVNMASETNGSWIDPSNYSSFTVTATNTTSNTPTNDAPVITTGTLTITFSTNPSGAAWIVNGTQYSSGQSATLEAGTYTVTYATVSGYDAPASETVTITANQTTSFTRVYTYEGVIILPPDVFNATGAPVNYSNGATEDTAAINGTYTKTAQNTTYNNITYPIYYNGYYYLYCSNDGYACLAKTATSTTSYWSASYCKNVNGQMFATEMTGQWSAPMGMGTSYALTFTSSSSGTQDYGKLIYEPVDTTKPYLNVSGTSSYDGDYYLWSGTANTMNTVWKHETENYFILYDGDETWYIRSVPSTSGGTTYQTLFSHQNVGPAETIFDGHSYDGIVTTTYNANSGGSSSGEHLTVSGASNNSYNGDYYLTSGSSSNTDGTAIWTKSDDSSLRIARSNFSGRWCVKNGQTEVLDLTSNGAAENAPSSYFANGYTYSNGVTTTYYAS